MVNEETIYTGNAQQGKSSEGALQNIVGKTWKPVTIGGTAGILLGAGALLAQHTIALNADAKSSAPADDVMNKVTPSPVEEKVAEEAIIEDQTALRVATVSDDLTFEQAFTQAREMVGPGGVFHWHGAIFSTYTADEWDEMTDEERDHFAESVRPEVDASQVDAEQLASVDDDIEPDSDIDDEGGEVFADVEVDQNQVADQDVADVPVHEANEEFIQADIREAEGGFALADEVDEDVVIADNDEMVQDIAMIDEEFNEDIAVAEDMAVAEDLAVAEDVAGLAEGVEGLLLRLDAQLPPGKPPLDADLRRGFLAEAFPHPEKDLLRQQTDLHPVPPVRFHVGKPFLQPVGKPVDLRRRQVELYFFVFSASDHGVFFHGILNFLSVFTCSFR